MVSQIWRRVIIDGLPYLVARGRPPIGPKPVIRTGRLTRFRAANNGAPPPDTSGGRPNPLTQIYTPDLTNTGILWPRERLDRPENYYNPPSTTTVNMTSAMSDTVIENKVLHGQWVRQSGNWRTKFKNCIIKGGPARIPNDTGIFNLHNTASGGTVFEDCLVEPQYPNYYQNFVAGNDFKAIRVMSYWVNDHYGVFTAPNSANPTRPTNVWILGCWMGPTVYWHSQYYLGQMDLRRLLTDGVTYASSGTFLTRTTSNTPEPFYPVKYDGTHNDGIEVQGGYGAMSAAASDNSRTGDGIWIARNTIIPWDASAAEPNPYDAVSLRADGSRWPLPTYLGTQDCPTRIAQSPSRPGPNLGSDTWKMRNGHYSSNGQSIVVVQNVNQLPSNCLVIEHNFFDEVGIGVNLQGKANGTLTLEMRGNRFGGHYYEYGRTSASGPSIYPMRIYGATDWAKPTDSPNEPVNTFFIGGKAAYDTNVWADPDERFASFGSPLIPGRNSGVQYTRVTTAN